MPKPQERWTFAFRVGPTAVREATERLRAAGLDASAPGTEHVYVAAPVGLTKTAAYDAVARAAERAGLHFLAREAERRAAEAFWDDDSDVARMRRRRHRG